MKKEYNAPKAEKVEFNYSEAVVASGGKKCEWVIPMGDTYDGCKEHEKGPGAANDIL